MKEYSCIPLAIKSILMLIRDPLGPSPEHCFSIELILMIKISETAGAGCFLPGNFDEAIPVFILTSSEVLSYLRAVLSVGTPFPPM